ncbi:hypothetical protein HDU79_008734 [Rhizoclosmatium sp. JEL0117]|nr:hypothetical protein HDU79_008734 [Rhizoclosmatium sp. JEL0117]
MVYLWSTTQTNMYMRLGYHSDHVKCLAYSSIGGWVASGGLDRRVMIWDTMEGRDREIVGFSVSSSVFCHDKSPQSSIYALATNPSGTTLVSGSPDKTIRVWDPRSGKQAIGLRGHRDNIRGLLVSDDGKWVVSASSDTTIKLWSLAHPQRCMVTYTQFEESVWCLYSNHPDLDTFWAGGKEGLVTKMSRRRVGGGDVGERSGTGGVNGGGTGERKKGGRLEDELVDCVAICREDGPVHKIVAVDDMFVWTATNKSSINRWRDIPFRQAIVVPNRNTIPEEPGDRIYIPADSIIQQQRAVLGGGRGNPFRKDSTLSHHHQTVNTTNGRQEIAGSYTMDDSLSRSASILSKDGFSLSNAANLSFSVAGGVLNSSFNDLDNEGDDEEEEAKVIPVWNTPDHTIEGSAGIVKYMLMNNRMHVVTEDSSGLVSLWDIVLCVKLKDFERPPKLEDGVDFFKKCCDEVNTFEWIANWCTIDTKNGVLTVHLDESKFYEAEVYYESVGQVPPMEDQRVNIGRWVLSYLFISYMHVFRQQIPPAAVMYHDHYFGALTYTQLAAPPDSTSHYLFGQTVYYGPPDLVFTNSSAEVLLQMQIQQQQGNQFPGSPLNPSYMNAAAKESSANTSPGLERKPRFDSLPRDGSTPGISIAAAETESVASGKGSESGEQTGTETPTMPPGPEKPVRLRPRPLIPATRPESVMMVESALSHVQQIIKKPVPYAPNPDELPVIRIPPDVSLLVSCEESPEAACYLDQFRSTVGQIGWVREAMRLHECIPRWVIEAINEKKLKEAPKMSFVMQPHPFSDLPELPNGANRLSSNRMIRLRKLLAYVADQAKITPPLNLVKAALMAQRLQQQHEGPPLDDRKPVPWTGVVNPGSVESLSVGPPPPVSSDTASTKSGVGNIFRRKRSTTSGAVSVNSETAIDSALLKDVNVKELVKPEEYLELVCQDKVNSCFGSENDTGNSKEFDLEVWGW